MNTIEIISLKIENLQGIKSSDVVLDGRNAEFRGRFGSGKTTNAVAHTWLWYGKDLDGRSSGGKSSFAIRPLDIHNKPIPDIITKVVEVVSFDGQLHTLRKEHKENIVRGKLKGYDTDCWVDDYHYNVGDFDAWLAGKINPQTFRLLTDPRYLNNDKQCPWSDRRNIVMSMADELPSVEGFDELHTARETRTVDQFKKVLADRKSATETEQHDTSTCIGENQHKLDEYSGSSDVESLKLRRDSLQNVINTIDKRRTEVTGLQTTREAKKEAIDKIKADMALRDIALAKDTSGIQGLLNKKAVIQTNLGKLRQGITDAKSKIVETEGTERLRKAELDSHQKQLAQARIDLADIKMEIAGAQTELSECGDVKLSDEDTTCYACGQSLPDDKIEEIRTNMQTKLEQKRSGLTTRLGKMDIQKSAIVTKGNRVNAQAKAKQTEIEAVQTDLVGLRETVKSAQELLATAEAQAKREMGVLDRQIADNPTKKPAEDSEWAALALKLDDALKDLGEPVSGQLETMDADRAAKQADLNKINEALAASDEIEKTQVRIEELTQTKQDLAQTLADTQKMLDMIDAYKEAESRLIETAVNNKFELITWKLFGQFINGNGDPCCVAILKKNGNEYRDCSGGERIAIDNDCVNVMSRHYGYQVPRFIDDFVLIDSDINSECQTFKLITDKACEQVAVTIESEVSDV